MELQLFLIWHNAIKYFPQIIEKLSYIFEIRGVFETTWNKVETLQKMQELYQFSANEAQEKLIECGYGKIIIVIVENNNPSTKLFATKYGVIPVSKYAQEIKEKIRQDFDCKNIIHGTMLDFEFEHDIKVCLGNTKEEFINKYTEKWNGEVCKL